MSIASRFLTLVLAFGFGISSIAQSNGRQLTGSVRAGGHAVAAGVPVELRIVGDKYVLSSAEPEVARALTDAQGRFVFDHLEKLGNHEGRELFAVSVQSPGYSNGFQVVDLTMVGAADVTLDLHKKNQEADSTAISSTGAAPRHSANAGAQKHLDRAQEALFRQHDPEGAIAELKLANKADPWYGPGYILLGLASMQVERWDDAQLAFSEASKVEPGNAQAYLGLGSALNEQHDYNAAQKALEQSLKLNPDSAEAHYELARSLYSLSKWEAAEPHVQRALELNPDYSGPHALMANIYLEQKDLPSARHELQEYLRLDPEGSLAPAAKQTIAKIDKALSEGTKH